MPDLEIFHRSVMKPGHLAMSVCLSITLVSCIKTVQARITKSSLWTAPRSSLSWQNFVPLGAAVNLERGRRRGVPS